MVHDFGKKFIPEHIFISSPTYLKIKKIHDINFFDVYIMSHSYRQWLIKKNKVAGRPF